MRDFHVWLARVSDVAAIALGAAVVSQLGFGFVAEEDDYAGLIAFAMASSLALFPSFGIYNSLRVRTVPLPVRQVSLGWLVVQGCALALMISLHHFDHLSRLWFAYWTGTSGFLMIAWRVMPPLAVRCTGRVGTNAREVAIIGCGEHCASIVRKIQESTRSGYQVSAVFNAAPDSGCLNMSPLFTDRDAFVEFVRARQISEVWLALPLFQDATMLDFATAFRDDLVNLRLIPDVRNIAITRIEVDRLLGEAAIDLVASPLLESAARRKIASRLLLSRSLQLHR